MLINDQTRFYIFFKENIFLSVFFIILPAVILISLIYKFGVNICWGDEWSFVPFLKKYYTGEILLSDFFVFHNEHQIPIPKLILLFSAIITNFNSKYQMFMSYFFLVCNFFVLLRYVKIEFNDNFKYSYFVLPSFLIFNMRQYENLLNGWQFQIPLSMFLILLSFYFLNKINGFDKYFFYSLLFAILSFFSFASGILVLPLIAFVLFFKFSSNRKLLFFIIVIVLISLFSIYISYYEKPIHHPNFLPFYPLKWILYFVTLIGSPLTTEKYTAFLIGIFILPIYLIIIRSIFISMKKNDYGDVFLFLIICFVLLSSFLISIGRYKYGWQQAIASRYVTISLFGPLAVYIYIIKSLIIKQNYSKRNFFILNIVIFLLFFEIITSFANYFKFYTEKEKRENFKKIIEFKNESIISINEILYLKEIDLGLYNKTYYLITKSYQQQEEYISFLKKYRLNLFYN
ncbi:MAG: hypothetical protein N2Z20_04385 [Elusimicrobiales bacterium]|nr:hypothetical protein [Elusimicrobiales bacterium]